MEPGNIGVTDMMGGSSEIAEGHEPFSLKDWLRMQK
jgi:hypothetical protein